jgi:catechol 2,3-dioxygenase-like lactoylglutathione lyase family enzyme
MRDEKVLKKIALIGVIVDDLNKAKDFYQSLGFTIDQELDLPSIQMKNAFISFQGSTIELIEPYANVQLPFHQDGKVNHFTFAVENIEETVVELKEKGVEFITEIDAVGNVKYVFGKGVNGEIIELLETDGESVEI